MDTQKAEKVGSLKTMANLLTLWLFLGCVAFALSFYFGANGVGVHDDKSQPTPAVNALSASVLCLLIYYVLLGIQAARLKKSPILWVGLSVLSSPMGPFISCFLIRGDTKEACKEILFPREEMNRIAEEGDRACQAGVSRAANPYSSPNTLDPNGTFADYWERGYHVAERRVLRAKN
jgi:hypothetical protein